MKMCLIGLREARVHNILTLILTVASRLSVVKGAHFPLSIIHINDFHARFEPTDQYGGVCDSDTVCIGGYARTVYMVKYLLEEQKDNNPVYFNAGDSFQGTLWYNIGRWNVTSQFLNMLPANAMTLGNHEFEHGVEGCVPFLETVNTTMLVANMDATDEPSMQGKYQKSMIIERSNRKIGVIGVILETTYDLANTGNLIFTNESVAIQEEAQKLKAEGANIIIVISHCGYDVDQLIAKNAGADIDVIVGAHSHTFLFTGDTPPGPDTPRGGYPTEVIHATGNRVLIVQAAAYAKYVGNITVYFDDEGNVVDYSGAPIYMSTDVPQDPDVVAALQPWIKAVHAVGNEVIGESKVDLIETTCSSTECNMGNFYCDAILDEFIGLFPYNNSNWTNTSISITNPGGMRVSLRKGRITNSHILSLSPFENSLMAFDLPGNRLREALEYGASAFDLNKGVTWSINFLQVSGLKITYNLTKPIGQRVIDMKVRCTNCILPSYHPWESDKIYRVVTSDFLVYGNLGFNMFKSFGTNMQTWSTVMQALTSFIRSHSPITTGLEGRITILD